jgi:hypothetical protein
VEGFTQIEERPSEFLRALPGGAHFETFTGECGASARLMVPRSFERLSEPARTFDSSAIDSSDGTRRHLLKLADAKQ